MNRELLYAYLAGAIDGDGYITIGKQVRTIGKKYQHHPTYYHAYIGFVNAVDPEVQKILQESFGGSVYKHIPKNVNHRTVVIWKAEGQMAGCALRALYPYLITKKRQAKLAIQFLDMVADQKMEIKATQKPPYYITPEMEERRKDLWEAVTKLNQPRNRRVHFLEETQP